MVKVIKAGKTIEAVGKEMGESQMGTVGATGPQPVGADPNDIMTIAYGMAPGTVSPPVSSSDYWTVFKVLRKTPGGVKDFNSVRKEAQRYTSSEMSETALRALLETLRTKFPVKIHADVLAESTLHHSPVPMPPAGGATRVPMSAGKPGGSK